MSNTTSKVITTKAGEALIAQMQAENKVLVIDKFVFANVPNRPDFPQREDTVPTADVVHESAVHEQGRLTENSVIYSTTLASDVGPFTFNWSGLYCTEHNTLVAINYPPAIDKTVDGPGVTGNTLVRSFVLEYKGIAETTNITVDPESWQYNAHKRMGKMDNDTSQAIIDQNGKDWFIEDGFIVTPQSTAYNIKAGAGYVSGNRIALEFDRIVQVPNKPSFIYVDAWREGTPTGEWLTKFNFVVSADEKDDYTDGQGVKHFVCKIAQVLVDGSVSDLRAEGESASRDWVQKDAKILADGGVVPRTLPDHFGDFKNVKDFGVVGDGIVDDTYAMVTAAVSKASLTVSDGMQIKITANTDTFTATEGQTEFTPTSPIHLVRTSVTVNGELVFGSYSENGLGIGAYIFDSGKVKFFNGRSAGDEVIISTSPIGLGHIDMRGNSKFCLHGVGAAAPSFSGGCKRISILSMDDKQSGIVLGGVSKRYDIAEALEFENSPIMFGRPNINGAYYLRTGSIIADNQNRVCNVGVEFGGDFPRTNVNYIGMLSVKGKHKRKVRVIGNQNVVEESDFLCSPGFKPIIDAQILGNSNEFRAHYDEAASGEMNDLLVEFGTKRTDVDENVYRQCTNNKFHVATSGRSSPVSTQYIDWNGCNSFTLAKNPLLGVVSGTDDKFNINLATNHEFIPNSAGVPWGLYSIHGAASRTDISTIPHDASKGTFPAFGRKALTITQDGTKYAGVTKYFASKYHPNDGIVNLPHNNTRNFPSLESLRGKYSTAGAWVYFDGTQEEYDKSGGIKVQLVSARGVGTTKPNEWQFITQSQIIDHDTDLDVLGGGRLSSSIRTEAAFTGKIHITGWQICVGEQVSPEHIPNYLDTDKGGNIYNDVAFPKSNTAEDTPLLSLQGYYLWVDSSGKPRIHNTRPTNLDTQGSVIGVQS